MFKGLMEEEEEVTKKTVKGLSAQTKKDLME